MGNKILRPSPENYTTGFQDEQLLYLADKFEVVADSDGFVNTDKLADAFQCSREEASRILNFMDFEGEGKVDFYEFKCAAASLHLNDEEAEEMIFKIYTDDNEMKQQHFELLYKTVYRYLDFVNRVNLKYDDQVAEKKFVKYDYNKNGSLNLDEFRSMLRNDYECRLWVQELGFAEESSDAKFTELEQKKQAALGGEGDEEFEQEKQAGDEALSVVPWKKTAKAMRPSGYMPPSDLQTPPSNNLEINYVYGYRSYDTRSNVKYSPKGQVVYHTAALGIVLDQSRNTMRVNTTHNDDITCLDTWKNLVVTGQMGRKPLIVVWNLQTMQSIAEFNKPLERCISNVAFSPSGKYIAAVSMCDTHDIAIYDITNKTLVSKGVGPKSVVNIVAFNSSEDRLVLGCAKEVVLADFKSKDIKLERGIFGKVPIMPTFALARMGDKMVSGMMNGSILIWKGNSLSKPLKEHTTAVTALCESPNGGLISGDAQGNIIVWSDKLVIEKKLSLAKLMEQKPSNNPKIIALSAQGSNILVGTRGGEIIQINLRSNPVQANVIMQGHFDKELWGMCTSPTVKNEFFTGGQDRLLYRWDVNKRKPIGKKKLEYPIMSLDINSKLGVLAVGFRNGIVQFFEAASLKPVKNKISNHKNPDKEVLSILKYSPDGDILAVGYCPPVSKVYLYSAANLNQIGVCSGSPSRITTIDFSTDSKSIIVNNTSYEILTYNASNGKQIGQGAVFHSQKWASMTCHFAWQTEGIWPPYADGTDINAVDRSHGGTLLATGDDFSKIKLFRYPACNPRQIFNIYKGHSSHITGVKWSADDRFLISIGGLEKSVIQWQLDQQEDVTYTYQEQQKTEEDSQVQAEDGEYESDVQAVPEKPAHQKMDHGDFEQADEEGDEALAVKPFLGQVKASTPSDFKPNNKIHDVLPHQSLQIEYAWGIRNQYLTDEVRNHLKYVKDGQSCVYVTAALGVELNIKRPIQQFYQGQSEDLISLAISPNRQYVATGQMAQINKEVRKSPKVQVHIWDVAEKKTQAVLKGFHKRAITVLEFSPSGQQLLSIGQDDMNTLAVYSWRSKTIKWTAPTSRGRATGAAWRNSKEYATVGVDHVKFWNEGKGTMGKIAGGKWDPMFCIAQCEGKYVSGAGSGALYCWNGGSGIKIAAHNGKVQGLMFDSKRNLYSGGGSSVIMWKMQGSSLTQLAQVLNITKISKFQGSVLAFDLSPDAQRILFCTSASEIFQTPLKNKTESKCLMQSHFQGQNWIATFSPDSTSYVSGGDDKTIRVYDLKSKEMKHWAQLDHKIRAADWQKSSGKLIVCGDWKGKIYLYDDELNLLDTGKTKFSKMKPRQSTYWIEDIKFSPDGKYVAFGAHGGPSHIEIFPIQGDKFGQNYCLKVGLTSALLHVDWNKASDKLAVVSQAYEYKFLGIDPATKNKADVSASSMKNEDWATLTCKFGWAVHGIWQDCDYSNINTVCADVEKKLIATGGDDQMVRLFKYPAAIERQKNKEYVGHSSHVTRVRFSGDDELLISSGGNDRTTILWRVQGRTTQKKQVAAQNSDQEEGQALDDDVDFPQQSEDEEEKEEKQPVEKDDFQEDNDAGDQFMAIKPWLGAIKEPTESYYKANGKAPNKSLVLEFAHGYRTKDCRNNLRYIDENHISYHTAALQVVMDISEQIPQQKFFDQHTNHILSIAWSPDKKYIYTGERGNKPIVYETSVSEETSGGKAFKGFRKGVMALDCNETYLAGAAMDDDHTVIVFNRKSTSIVAKANGGKAVIISLKWIDDKRFVSVGIKHYCLWDVSEKEFKPKKGKFGKDCDILCCVTVKQSKIYVGAGNGNLQVWQGTDVSKSINKHQGALDAICPLDRVLLTGGKDRKINVISFESLATLISFDCRQLLQGSCSPEIRALDVYGSKLLVGTLGSEIYQLSGSTEIDEADESLTLELDKVLMNGHFTPNSKWTNQVWGLCMFGENYLTCSDDATVRHWDIESKKMIASQRIDFDEKLKTRKKDTKTGDFHNDAKARCIAVTDDNYVLVGTLGGTCQVLDSNLKPKGAVRVSKHPKSAWISDIKVSKDGSMVAFASHDTNIYLHDYLGGGRLKFRHILKAHNAYVRHLDFSKDGNYIHSVCGAYELLFFDTQSGKQVTGGASALRNEDWATWTSILGWPVQGIWSPFMDGTDINAVDRSNELDRNRPRLLAAGDDRSKVSLFEYPCLVKSK